MPAYLEVSCQVTSVPRRLHMPSSCLGIEKQKFFHSLNLIVQRKYQIRITLSIN